MVYALSLLLPFFYILLNSFKTNPEFGVDAWALPQKLIKQGLFSNYTAAFKEWDIGSMFINSIVITLGGTFFGVLSPTLVAYVLAKYKFRFNSLIFSIALVFMVLPDISSTVSTYKLMLKFDLINTYFGLFLLYAKPFTSYFFILYSFFLGISWSYAEAAFIDCASDLQVCFKVMLPQATAGILAIVVMQAISVYNDYFLPYMYMPNAFTVATGLQNLSFNAQTTGAYVQMFSAIIVTSVPVILLFALMQKTIMNNVSMGGLKG
jgi:raffinose/stachyose/melibiose transport system permease protein/N-acetylglucosamine transport system permease protein